MVLSSCAAWKLIGENNSRQRFTDVEFTLPIGWVQETDQNDIYYYLEKGSQSFAKVDRVTLTRHGKLLAFITITRFDPDLAFPAIGKSASADTLLPELAERSLAEQIKQGLGGYVVENVPVKIAAGPMGFRLRVAYDNENKVPVVRLVYGFLTAKGMYIFQYEAIKTHFYAAYLPAFENVIQSIRILH